MDGQSDRAEQTDQSPAAGSAAEQDSTRRPAVLQQAAQGQAAPAGGSGAPPSLGKWLVIYSVLRLGLLVVLAAGLALLMPLILALLFAIVLALPLSWLLFAGVRRRVNEAMAISTATRRAERERLLSALHGPEL